MAEPHDALQGDHCDQADTTHGDGQGTATQNAVRLTAGQGEPVPAAALVMIREEDFLPVPQVAEQADQVDHKENWQFTGQTGRLQDAVRVSGGHCLAPLEEKEIARVEVFVILPQDALHFDQVDHKVTGQLKGQAGRPHDSERVRIGHAAPRFAAGCCTFRVDERIALPHVTEHAVQADQELTKQ